MAEEPTSSFRDTHGTISVEWDIKLFDLPQQHGEFVSSPTFWLSNAECCISVCPNSETWESNFGWISLFLDKKIYTEEEHHISYSIGIKKTDGSVFKSVSEDIFGKVGYWGEHEFLKRTVLFASKGVIAPDGAVTFFCNARILDSTKFKCCVEETASRILLPKSVETLSKNFRELYLDGSDSDLKITVGPRDFRAHKLILATRCKVFASMFQHDMTENTSGIVNISDCDPDSFGDFLIFIYTGQLDHVSSSNIRGLYIAAEKYDMVELKEECSRLLFNEVSVESVCDLIFLATMYNDSEMRTNAIDFFINNSAEVMSTEKWKYFLVENMSLANDLLMEVVKRFQSRA